VGKGERTTKVRITTSELYHFVPATFSLKSLFSRLFYSPADTMVIEPVSYTRNHHQLMQWYRLFWQHRSAPAAARLSCLASSVRCSDRELKVFLLPSLSLPTAVPSTQPSSKTMSASSTSPWTSYTWSSSPTVNPTFSRTSTRYTSSLRLSQASAEVWTNARFCAMPLSF
jgi:hypothetical protein